MAGVFDLELHETNSCEDELSDEEFHDPDEYQVWNLFTRQLVGHSFISHLHYCHC